MSTDCMRNLLPMATQAQDLTRNSSAPGGRSCARTRRCCGDQPRPRGGGPAPPPLVRRARGAPRCAGGAAAPGRACGAGAALHSGLSRLIDRIEKKGLVERRVCETDRRAFFIELTDEGREMLDQMWPVYARGIADDFLPALGSNPCEIRADARVDRRAVRRRPRGRRGRGGRGRLSVSPAGRARSRRTSSCRGAAAPWPTRTSFGSSARAASPSGGSRPGPG